MGVGSGASAGGVSSGIASEIITGGPVNKKTCSNCHSQMDNDQRFCRDCGGTNKIVRGSVEECDFCGSPISM